MTRMVFPNTSFKLRLPGVEPGSIAWKAFIPTVGLQTCVSVWLMRERERESEEERWCGFGLRSFTFGEKKKMALALFFQRSLMERESHREDESYDVVESHFPIDYRFAHEGKTKNNSYIINYENFPKF